MIKGIAIKSTGGGYISAAALRSEASLAFIRVSWAQVQDADGQFAFAKLDNVCNTAIAANKKLILEVSAGNVCSGWVHSGNIIPKLFFIDYRRLGSGNQFSIWLPNVCHPLYVSKICQMIEGVIAHLKTTPIYEHIVAFKVSGINRDSEELRLCANRPSPAMPNATDSHIVWENAGYTESKITTLFDAILNTFSENTDKILNLAIIPKLALPFDEDNSLLKSLIAMFKTRPNIAINSTALTETGGTPKIVTESGMPFGFQINFNQYAYTQNESALRAVLQNGVNKGAQFIELSDANCCNFPELIKEYDKILNP